MSSFFALATILLVASGCAIPPSKLPSKVPQVTKIAEPISPELIEQRTITEEITEQKVKSPLVDYLENRVTSNNKIRAAVILPLTARGAIGIIAENMRHAAEMSVFDFNEKNISLIFLDSRGTKIGTREAARKAVTLGVDVVLGPMLSVNVPTAWQEISPYNIPIIAFSSDISVAGSGVYLLSVAPEHSIDSVIGFAVDYGLLRYAALVPDTTYGLVSEQAFVESALNHGAAVLQIVRYKPNSRAGIAAAEKLAKWIRSRGEPVDAIFLPDSPDMVKTLAPVFPYHSVDTQSVRLIGSGLWKSADLKKETAMIGAWFSSPADFAFDVFANRFKARFKTRPNRLAALAYDGVSLLVHFAQRGVKPSNDNLTDKSGFFGIDGLFRFLPNGLTERSLDVMQVSPRGSELVSPALLTFKPPK